MVKYLIRSQPIPFRFSSSHYYSSPKYSFFFPRGPTAARGPGLPKNRGFTITLSSHNR